MPKPQKRRRAVAPKKAAPPSKVATPDQVETKIVPGVSKVIKYKIDRHIFKLLGFQNKEIFKEVSDAYEEEVILSTFDKLAERCQIIDGEEYDFSKSPVLSKSFHTIDRMTKTDLKILLMKNC